LTIILCVAFATLGLLNKYRPVISALCAQIAANLLIQDARLSGLFDANSIPGRVEYVSRQISVFHETKNHKKWRKRD
jgi:hypothetical protein